MSLYVTNTLAFVAKVSSFWDAHPIALNDPGDIRVHKKIRPRCFGPQNIFKVRNIDTNDDLKIYPMFGDSFTPESTPAVIYIS